MVKRKKKDFLSEGVYRKGNFELGDQVIWGEITGWPGVAQSAHFFD